MPAFDQILCSDEGFLNGQVYAGELLGIQLHGPNHIVVSRNVGCHQQQRSAKKNRNTLDEKQPCCFFMFWCRREIPVDITEHLIEIVELVTPLALLQKV